MKVIKKKSADSALDKILITAAKSKIELAWDRSEKQQPQCGFSKCSLCCNDCEDGPCRISPFGDEQLSTVCGRTKEQLECSEAGAKFADGAVSLAKLAEDAGVSTDGLLGVLSAKDAMGCTDLAAVGTYSAKLLQDVAKKVNCFEGSSEANLGVLKADAANILAVGFVKEAEIEKLLNAGVNVVAGSGNELTKGIPVITNYVSMEAVLVTGAVDAVIAGTQCVKPGLAALAAKSGVAVTATAEEALEAAKLHAAKNVTKLIPDAKAVIHTDLAAVKTDKLVFMSGCGNVVETQDYLVLKQAKAYIDEGYTVLTCGCLGTALAKAGLCENGTVVDLGSCMMAGAALEKFGTAIKEAYFCEITKTKMYAIAAAFAASGIKTIVKSKKLLANNTMTVKLAELGVEVIE